MLEHGTFTLEIKGNIIIVSQFGEYNEPGIIACLEAQKQAIESFGEQECFLLVDSTGQTGATPEVYKRVDEFYHELNCSNLSAVAVIHTHYVLTRLHEREIPELQKYRTKLFSDTDSAIAWLEGCKKSDR
jgi:hypothetical protein